MNNEYFSGFDTKDSFERFDGKHHVIATAALQGIFDGEDDIKNAWTEMINE